MGAGRPAISTDVPAKESARIEPRIEIKLPGAIGDCATRLAELSTAPGVMMGTLRLVRNPPLICTDPLSFCSGICALTWIVTFDVVAVRGCQVPLQLPSCECFRTWGGSPSENVATAEPVSMGLPQSSTTRTPTVLGQAAATAKVSASEVKTGAS